MLVVMAGHRGDVDTLRAALSSADQTVVASVLSGLARCNALDATTLVAALTGPGRTDAALIRVGFELAPGVPGPPHDGLGKLLLEALRGTDEVLAEVAAWALGERHTGDPAEWEERPPAARPEDLLTVVSALAEVAAGHADALCREAAVAALGSIGHPAGAAAVVGAMTDKATVRRRAVIALAAFDGPEVEAALTAALVDRDWQVRQAAEDLSCE